MLTRILTIAGPLVCIGLCLTPGSAVAQPAPARGRTLFETRCATCHGMDARGGQAPSLAGGTNAATSTDDRLRRVIRDGLPAGMPGVGATMTAADITALIAHLRQLQHAADDAGAVPGNADAGRTLFFGSANCAQCHMAEGRGGFLASDLSRTRLNAQALRQAILGQALSPAASAKNALTMLTLRDGQQVKGVVRNEDNFTIQVQDERGAFHSIDKASIASRARDARPLMPADYGTRLPEADVQNLVRYLVQLAAR